MKESISILIFGLGMAAILYYGTQNANSDLHDIASTQDRCKSFKQEYDVVKPFKNTKRIEEKIQECRDAGAWGEGKK